MAEGLLRHLGGAEFEAHSAGTEASEVRPLAIRAMAEVGIDISSQRSKTLDQYRGAAFDLVVTVCDQARDACPVFSPGTPQRHWSFPDPSAVAGSEDEQLAVYRQIRDGLRARMEQDLLAARP